VKISIITVSYNSEQTIEDTILSVINQSYKNIEYIIIDGASTDSTHSILNKYQNQISKIISEKDHGIYDAMNKGILAATGDVIGILNSDDMYADSQVIKNIVALLQKENTDGVYADLQYVKKDNTTAIVRTWKSGSYKEGKFLLGWMPPHPTFFVKKQMYDQFGTYNTIFKSAADYELMLRFIHKNKIKLSYLPRVIIKMRAGGKSNVTLSNRIKANIEDRKAWEINELKPNFFTLFIKPLSKLVQFIKK
jgi:glycosyltransferase involved in cell wall biosynthesis